MSMHQGDSGDAVRAAQEALAAAGYRLTVDGEFGPSTEAIVRQFQAQHDLTVDGAIGPATLDALSVPPDIAVNTARPLVHASGWPHDDTSSLLAFYGKPWENDKLLTRVIVPFSMTYETTIVRSVQVHSRVAPALTQVFSQILSAAAQDANVLNHVRHFSGSYNYRAVRGSSRLSCHAFGAALDFDADRLPMTHERCDPSIMPQQIVNIFKAAGAFWGGEYRDRKDPMHFQWAHE